MMLHVKSGRKTSGWLFPDESGLKPMDLHNLCQRKLKPAFAEKGLEWKGLYSSVEAWRHTLPNKEAFWMHRLCCATRILPSRLYAKLTAGGRLRAIKFLEAGVEVVNMQ